MDCQFKMKVSFFQRIRLLVTLIIGACALASIVGANPVVLHVDAKGSSDGYDTDEKAFANLQAALDKVGKGKRIGDVEIWVHEGMYPVSNSILLNPRSLKRVNSLLIRSAPGEEVVFFGGSGFLDRDRD